MGVTKSQPMWVDEPRTKLSTTQNNIDTEIANENSPLLDRPKEKKTAPLSRFHGMFRFR